MTARTFIVKSRFDVECVLLYLRSRNASHDNPIAVDVSTVHIGHTDAQRRLYWSILGEIADGAWIDGRRFAAEVWHEHYKGKFIGWQDLPHGGRTPMSTRTLDVGAMSEYIDRVRADATTEFNVELTR